jgi:transcriptional regulator with XRE-family HTH domain
MKLRIKELRKAKGLTIDDLAAIVGMSRSYVNELENGKKTINGRRLEQFAKALDVTIYDLIDDADASAEIMRIVDVLKDLEPSDRASVMRHAQGLQASQPKK